MGLSKMAKDLHHAAFLCNDELGEWWDCLAEMRRHVEYGSCSPEFAKAYEAEVFEQHKRLKEEFVIEEIEEPQPPLRRTIIRHISEISE
jgi:hypothetical protein